ncbi:6624_t:CDS:2 [Gigaspora rosea]|nr:6624_t:CDS:2 [Gigaspora rosea]
MRDIILRLRGGPLECIHEGHPAYLPLHYVLLFPYSELGWHSELQQIVFDEFGQHAENQSNAPCLTQMDFYSFRLFSCHAEFSTILRDEILKDSNYSLTMCPPMPLWERNWGLYSGNRLIAKHLA